MEKCLTADGLEKLKKELELLKTVKRQEIAEALRYAISFGDLSENAAYTEAKEAQAFLEGRILELEDTIRNVKITDYNRGKINGQAVIGSVVLVESEKAKREFFIVCPNEAEPMEGKISSESPLGRALLGKRNGNVVEVFTPIGKVSYKILKIS